MQAMGHTGAWGECTHLGRFMVQLGHEDWGAKPVGKEERGASEATKVVPCPNTGAVLEAESDTCQVRVCQLVGFCLLVCLLF